MAFLDRFRRPSPPPPAPEPSQEAAADAPLVQAARNYVDFAQRAKANELRPYDPGSRFGSEAPTILDHPLIGIDLPMMSWYSPVLTAIQLALRNQVLRKLPEVKPAFGAKCPKCGWEDEEALDTCPEEGCETPTVKPDPSQRMALKKFLDKPSLFGTTWRETLEISVDDNNIVDDGFWILTYDYKTDPSTGAIVGKKLMATDRLDPLRMAVVADPRGRWTATTPEGQELGYYTCPVDRLDNLYNAPGTCHKCGERKLYPVRWVVKKGAEPEIGYFDDEVVHWQVYRPSPWFGISPVLTGWALSKNIMNADRMYGREVEQNRPPKGVLWFSSSNPESFLDAFAKEETLSRQDPMHILKVIVEGGGGEKAQGAGWIPLSFSTVEMAMVDQVNRMARWLCAIYGVQPIVIGDTESGGGLNNERLQLQVYLWSVERFHHVFEDRVFPKLLDALGITDWILEFPPALERDEAQLLERRKGNVELIEKLLRLGATIDKTNEDDWAPEWSGELSLPEPEPSPFGGPGPDGEDQDPDGGAWDDDLDEDKTVAEPGWKFDPVVRAGVLERAFLGAMDSIWAKLEPGLLERFRVFRDPTAAKEQAHRLIESIVGKLRGVADRHYTRLLLSGFRDAGVPLGQAALMRPALEALQDRSVLWESFAGMTDQLSSQVDDVIERAFQRPLGYDLKAMVDEMRGVVDAQAFRLERIARTESQHVVNVGRAEGFKRQDPEGDFVYRWAGPNDHRTTPICSRIKTRTGDGKNLEQLAEIVRAESLRGNGPKWVYRDWTPHIQCRHRLLRVVVR